MSYVSPFTGDVIQPTDVSYRGFTLSADTTLSWPINGNATGNYAARIMDVTASAGSLSLFMPPGNQTSVGTDSLIRNTGANSFTVKTSTGATILSIASGEAQYIYLTDNSTVGGTWGIIAFGVGTSSADAATLQGYGLLAIRLLTLTVRRLRYGLAVPVRSIYLLLRLLAITGLRYLRTTELAR